MDIEVTSPNQQPYQREKVFFCAQSVVHVKNGEKSKADYLYEEGKQTMEHKLLWNTDRFLSGCG